MDYENNPYLKFFHLKTHRNAELRVYHSFRKSGACASCKQDVYSPTYENSSAVIGTFCKGYFHERSKAVRVGPEWPEAFTTSEEAEVLRGDVVEAMISEGITGFRPHRLKVQDVDDDGQWVRPVPPLYQLEITGRVDLSAWYSDGELVICPTCHQEIRPKDDWRLQHREYFPLLESWNGADLVRAGNLARSPLLCTSRFVDLARTLRWKAFYFVPFPIGGMQAPFLKTKNWFSRVVEELADMRPDLFPQKDKPA